MRATNLSFTLGETWEIAFEAQDAEGARIAPADIEAIWFTIERRGLELMRLDDGEAGGVEEDGQSPPNWMITVTPAQQLEDSPGLVEGVYAYGIWIRLSEGGTVSHQAGGTLHARE